VGSEAESWDSPSPQPFVPRLAVAISFPPLGALPNLGSSAEYGGLRECGVAREERRGEARGRGKCGWRAGEHRGEAHSIKIRELLGSILHAPLFCLYLGQVSYTMLRCDAELAGFFPLSLTKPHQSSVITMGRDQG
jgi:hypothetical protein